MMRIVSIQGSLSILLACTSVAIAQPSQTSASAIALFDQGRALLKEGKFEEACAAFAQSEKLDPAFGTLYNLANCDVHIGKLASAWSAFRELAQRDTNAVRREDAGKQAALLEPRLAHLEVELGKRPDGVVVRLDDVDITAAVGTAMPIDLGNHQLDVTAPSFTPWHQQFEITSEAQRMRVVVELVPRPPASAPVSVAVPRPQAQRAVSPNHASHTAAFVVFGIGGAGLATGAIFGELANLRWGDAKQACGGDLSCGSTANLTLAQQRLGQARTRADLSTGFVAGGVAAIGLGVVLLLVGSGDETHVDVTPNTIAYRGRW